MNKLAALLVVMFAATAHADRPAKRRAVSLRVKSIPVDVSTLAIRSAAGAAAVARPVVKGPPIKMSSLSGVPTGAAAAAAEGNVSAESDVETSWRPVPTSTRDLQERVIFRFNIGYEVTSAATSGDIGKNGFVPEDITDPDGNEFDDTRQYLLGDAVLGSRGILLPSLNTYFLSQYQFDFDGGSQFASLNNVYDVDDGRDLLVHAAYAEIDGVDLVGLPGLHIRGGRQYRYGPTMYVTKFDGINAGYDAEGFGISGFFGRRASVFFNDDPGILGGGGLEIKLEALADVPVDIAADYLFFDGGAATDLDGDGEDEDLARQYVELRARAKLGQNSRLIVRGRLAANGEHLEDGEVVDGAFALARIGAQLRQAITERLLLVADIEQKFEDEVSYDYINPYPVDVVNIAEQLGIGLDPAENATLVGGRLSAMLTRELELYGFARANLVSDSQSGFRRSWEELGAAASARISRPIAVTAQYKLRATQLDDDANLAGSEFDDTSGSGVSSFHELAGEARYSLGYRRLTVAGGGYFRVYSLQSPYAEVTDDARLGARGDVDVWFTKMTRLKLAGEAAQPSPTFASELSTLVSFRALMEVLF